MFAEGLIELLDQLFKSIDLSLQFLFINFPFHQVDDLVQIRLVSFQIQIRLYLGENHLELAHVDIAVA